jgi:hypothetical protein
LISQAGMGWEDERYSLGASLPIREEKTVI